MSSDIDLELIVIDGESIDGVRVPESTDELKDVLREIVVDRQHAAIVGGGTRLAFGNAGGPFDIAISTRKLNRILQYEPDNMTIAVEPGCTIAQIRDALAGNRQSMALDAAHAERSTIGGAYATGMSGPRRLGGGSLKDWVIGVEVVGPDSVLAKAGGMVVKNVTGFDMMHLHYGALGAFGVVARLNLKVFPAPSASRTIDLSYSTAEEAHAAAVAIFSSQLQPAAVSCWNDETGWHATARCDAPETAIETLVARMVTAAVGASEPIRIDTANDGASMLDSFTTLVDLSSGDVIVRLPVTASKQSGTITGLAERGWRVFADLGSGLVYARQPGTDGVGELPGDLANVATWLAAPATLKAGRDIFGPTPAAVQPILRRLKDSFDPDRRLNRGRFALGL